MRGKGKVYMGIGAGWMFGLRSSGCGSVFLFLWGR